MQVEHPDATNNLVNGQLCKLLQRDKIASVSKSELSEDLGLPHPERAGLNVCLNKKELIGKDHHVKAPNPIEILS